MQSASELEAKLAAALKRIADLERQLAKAKERGGAKAANGGGADAFVPMEGTGALIVDGEYLRRAGADAADELQLDEQSFGGPTVAGVLETHLKLRFTAMHWFASSDGLRLMQPGCTGGRAVRGGTCGAVRTVRPLAFGRGPLCRRGVV